MPIKRGVSFYSYQQSYYKGENSLEELIRLTSETVGAEGVELLYEQMPVGAYPYPADADVDRWHGWMEKYKTKPVCMDSFLDYMLYKGRICTLKEQVQMMEQDLRLAARLGFPAIRVLCPVRKETVEASIPIAEHYNVKMGLEVHSPMTLRSRWVLEYLDMFERSGSKHVGIIPDFGIFQLRPSKKALDNAIAAGADQKILDHITSSCENRVDFKQILAEIKKMGAGGAENAVAMSFARVKFSEPEWLRDIAKYIVHCHAKFYDMNEQCEETCIDYQAPVAILKDIGYDGYLCSEFEGQSLYKGADEADELEQVRRHHVMLQRLLDK